VEGSDATSFVDGYAPTVRVDVCVTSSAFESSVFVDVLGGGSSVSAMEMKNDEVN
jgi:hypothetical protein